MTTYATFQLELTPVDARLVIVEPLELSDLRRRIARVLERHAPVKEYVSWHLPHYIPVDALHPADNDLGLKEQPVCKLSPFFDKSGHVSTQRVEWKMRISNCSSDGTY